MSTRSLQTKCSSLLTVGRIVVDGSSDVFQAKRLETEKGRDLLTHPNLVVANYSDFSNFKKLEEVYQ